ncbi:MULTISPECIES: metallophosphoesterase family protein [unclassified Yoonia]|uniref:metallophosphoesterase family protein n=1 Tax=unclassified Yoonia TaxID=2629118 RepID=UPI002AFFE23B|nr:MULTISPECIES: metallophosphoesterase [unclassified Yoonia]
MVLIAQITDLHLRDDGAYPAHDPADALRRAFAQIAAMAMRPDAIILTGDIIDRSARGYDAALGLLRDAPVPLLPMPGNHDPAPAFRAAFADWVDYAPDHLSFTRQIGDLHLIALDSTLPDGSGGVDHARLAWLEQALARATGPVLFALHHPPFPTGAPHLDKAGFTQARALAGLVAQGAVCRVIAGHAHRAMQSLWAGCLASTAPAIGHGLSLSLTGADPHNPVQSEPAFELHLIAPDHMVTHWVGVT